MKAPIGQYYLSMLSLSVVVLVLSTAATAVLDRLEHVLHILPAIGALLVALNLVGAWVLIAPVARLLKNGGNPEAAIRRLRRLPWLSAGWVFALVMLFMAPRYYFAHLFCLECDHALPPLVAFYRLVLVGIYGVLLALCIYFLIEDYAARLRQELFRRHGFAMGPYPGRVLYRVLAAFMATSFIPMLLVFFEAFFLSDLRDFQHVDVLQAFQIAMLSALLLATAAIVFITRSLTRPVEILFDAMQRADQGDLDTRAPVVSDDEMGVLTSRFNSMIQGMKERAFIRRIFGRFVPESVAAAVLEDHGVLHPQMREATVLFTDIEGFTAVTEKLPPADTLAMLNDYFTLAAEPIRKLGGVITQFQGDAILATFNLPVEAPDHAALAVRAAQAIQLLLRQKRFTRGIELNTRIGINTGPVVGGTVGGGDRLGYTVHGDVVNVAAKLERFNKEFATSILVAERTVELTHDWFDYRRIGEVMLPGHETPVAAYELLTEAEGPRHTQGARAAGGRSR